MASKQQSDFFDGIFDNQATRRREVRQDGRVLFHAERICCGNETAPMEQLHAPWGSYPDVPAEASASSAGSQSCPTDRTPSCRPAGATATA